MEQEQDAEINAQIAINADCYSKAQLARALFDLLDGNSSVDDIVRSTGLADERALEISRIFAVLSKNV